MKLILWSILIGLLIGGATAAYAASQTIALQPGDVASVSCATSIGGNLGANPAQVWCATPVPTAAATSTVPTSTPTPQPTEPVPLCADETPTVWHPLAEFDAAGNVTCTTSFTSGDDPSAVNDIFGAPGAWFGSPGQSIGYPWSDSSETQGSNARFYKWEVRRDLLPSYPGSSVNYFRAFRVENHIHASGGTGIQKEYHSFSFEAQICSPDGNCGIARVGGIQDYGALMVNDATAGDVCVIANANNPPGQCYSTNRKIVAGLNSTRRDATWYGCNVCNHQNSYANIDANVGVIEQAWGPVDTSNLGEVLYWDPNTYNASQLSAEVMAFQAPASLAVNGRVNASGYTDQYGNIQPPGLCGAVGPTCVPFVLQNIPTGYTQYRDSVYNSEYGTSLGNTSYDVHVNGQSVIRYPN